MLRTGASRSLLRSLNTAAGAAAKGTRAPARQQLRSQLCTLSRRPQPLVAARPLAPQALVWARGASSTDRPTVDQVDKKREEKIQEKKIPATPEAVTATSTVIPATGTSGEGGSQEEEPQMMAGIMHDFATIRQTFSLEDVPEQAYYMGLAGVLPYMATSLSTVYCAWEINHAAETGTGMFLTEQTAESLLHIIEPLQVGYGAVILSFLGAIHWGLEWAQYGGTQGYPRYAIGVISTAVAWPTILLPVEYALITQFLAFNFLYYTDVRAKTRGWTPPWYGIYRFVLTFIVGGSIVVSLIGRGQIADKIQKAPPSTADRIRALGEYHPDEQEDMEASEIRKKYLPDEGEDDEDEEDEEGGEDEQSEGGDGGDDE